MSKNDTGQKLIVDEENLQHHAMIVMDGIGRVVDSIDDTQSLMAFLQYVGHKHMQNDVKPHMLEVSIILSIVVRRFWSFIFLL